ncbi:MAG TPA: hypothetical protein VH186_37925 [Chloroflexia bacterium]|nr:hypothetical protein [Chloroflexia bacterium]
MEMEEFDSAGCAKAWLWGNRLFVILAILLEALFSLDSFWGERPLE